MINLIFHPLTIISFFIALFFFFKNYPLPPSPEKTIWTVSPALFNLVVWIIILKLFSLTMAGLAAWFQYFVFIPLNGLLFGFFSLAGLHHLLHRIRTGWKKTAVGLTVQLLLLMLNFILWYIIDAGELITTHP